MAGVPKHPDHGFMLVLRWEKVGIRKKQKNSRNPMNFQDLLTQQLFLKIDGMVVDMQLGVDG